MIKTSSPVRIVANAQEAHSNETLNAWRKASKNEAKLLKHVVDDQQPNELQHFLWSSEPPSKRRREAVVFRLSRV